MFFDLYRVFKNMEQLPFDSPVETKVVRQVPYDRKGFYIRPDRESIQRPHTRQLHALPTATGAPYKTLYIYVCVCVFSCASGYMCVGLDMCMFRCRQIEGCKIFPRKYAEK